MKDQLLNERDVAELTRMSVASLRQWRFEKNNVGPRFVKVGSSVRYRMTDVQRWIKSRPIGGPMKIKN
jgi:predicted DNA-binding transcriptional regulator AlpA